MERDVDKTYNVIAYSESSFGIIQLLMNGTFPKNPDAVKSLTLFIPEPPGHKSMAAVDGDVISVTDGKGVTLFFTAEEGLDTGCTNTIVRVYLTSEVPN